MLEYNAELITVLVLFLAILLWCWYLENISKKVANTKQVPEPLTANAYPSSNEGTLEEYYAFALIRRSDNTLFWRYRSSTNMYSEKYTYDINGDNVTVNTKLKRLITIFKTISNDDGTSVYEDRSFY